MTSDLPREAHRRGFRPEVQALRALAVGIVVVYHFWPHLLPGGFVGVDVFFVVSGFLITAHLLREFETRGRVSLPEFWARRARRLLPASLLVLVVTAAGVVVFSPGVQWAQSFKEIAASALYVQNWVLAADSIDYLAAENAASPVQHFWSLSVEEQFYLIWPVILVLVALAVNRGGRRSVDGRASRRRAMLLVLAVITAASLAYSIYLTFTSPGAAYFVTPTRAWEFGAGALLAFVATSVERTAAAVRGLVAWAGWIAIVVAAFTYSGAVAFPGYSAALPVLGTVAILWAGRADVVWAPDRFLAIRPAVFVGDISYAVYLWHWPVLIFAGFALGDDLRWWIKFVLIGGVLLVAWVSTKFIEDPIRRGAFLTRRKARYTFAAVLVSMALVAVPATGGYFGVRQAAADQLAQAEQLAEEGQACFGAAFRDPEQDCEGVTFDQLTPDPSAAIDDRSDVYDTGCHANNRSEEVRACEFGPSGADYRVALIGDSHAVNWLPALQTIAEEENWNVTLLSRAACPYILADQIIDDQTGEQTCGAWKDNVRDYLASAEPFDLALTLHAQGGAKFADDEVEADGVRAAWKTLTDRGTKVVVIRDVPRMNDGTSDCLLANRDLWSVCDRAQEEALAPHDLFIDLAQESPEASTIDLSEFLCWAGTCKAVVGGVVAFRDSHHITRTLSITFAPYLLRELERVLR